MAECNVTSRLRAKSSAWGAGLLARTASPWADAALASNTFISGSARSALHVTTTTPSSPWWAPGARGTTGGPGRKTAFHRVARSTHANTMETQGLSGGDSPRMRTAGGTVAAGIQARGWPAMASGRDACTTSKGGGAAGAAAAIAESTRV